MSFEIIIFLTTLFGLAGIGTPVGYSIIASSILYFSFGDMDIALAGEKILQGLYKSFILLAVPLFITAANIMNVGTITDRLLSFCIAAVGRFKGGLGHVNVVASLIFSGMSGSAVADAAGIGKIIIGMMTKNGRYTRGYAAAITAASATIGPIIPPLNTYGSLFCYFRHINWLFVFSWNSSRFNYGFSINDYEYNNFT